MYLLVNLLIKLSMLQWRMGLRPLEIYSRPLGWRTTTVKNHWYIGLVYNIKMLP